MRCILKLHGDLEQTKADLKSLQVRMSHWRLAIVLFRNESYIKGLFLLSTAAIYFLYIPLSILEIYPMPYFGHLPELFIILPLTLILFGALPCLAFKITSKIRLLRANSYWLKAIIYAITFWVLVINQVEYERIFFLDLLDGNDIFREILLKILIYSVGLIIITEKVHLPYALFIYFRSKQKRRDSIPPLH